MKAATTTRIAPAATTTEIIWLPVRGTLGAAPPRPARPTMASAYTLTYWYAAIVALLVNVLATASLIAAYDIAGYLAPYLQAVALFNLAGYVVIIGALRTGQFKDN